MPIGHLQVVFLGHGAGVSKPGADRVNWIFVRQFGLAGRSQVVPKFWPLLYPGLGDDLAQLGPQVARAAPIPGDDVDATLFGLIKDVLQGLT